MCYIKAIRLCATLRQCFFKEVFIVNNFSLAQWYFSWAQQMCIPTYGCGSLTSTKSLINLTLELH